MNGAIVERFPCLVGASKLLWMASSRNPACTDAVPRRRGCCGLDPVKKGWVYALSPGEFVSGIFSSKHSSCPRLWALSRSGCKQAEECREHLEPGSKEKGAPYKKGSRHARVRFQMQTEPWRAPSRDWRVRMDAHSSAGWLGSEIPMEFKKAATQPQGTPLVYCKPPAVKWVLEMLPI